MALRVLVRSSELIEAPPGRDVNDQVPSVQGVGPGEPRRLVIPFFDAADRRASRTRGP